VAAGQPPPSSRGAPSAPSAARPPSQRRQWRSGPRTRRKQGQR
jgi:hypothetical protein